MRSVEEIRADISELERRRSAIDLQLLEPRNPRNEGPDFNFKEWKYKAMAARRALTLQFSPLNAEMGEAGRREKKERASANIHAANTRSVPFEREFLYAAKQVLPDAMYLNLLALATDACASKQAIRANKEAIEDIDGNR